MRLWRADNPEVAMNLIPWFVPTNQNPIQMGWELHERLKEKPEDTFCLVALRGRIVQAVLIAYKKGRRVHIWQAHARYAFRYSRIMLDGLIYWAKGKGIKRIKAKVSNEVHRRLYERRYGFRCKRNKEMYLNV